MAEEDDRWALAHLKDADERGKTFGVGSFRLRGEDGLVHRCVWSSSSRGWSLICQLHDLMRKKVRTPSDAVIDPGAITCFQCISKGA
jgi:hypothetical protein